MRNPGAIVLKKNFLENGLFCLEEKSRSGRPPSLDGSAKAKITALACSPEPERHARWSLRHLADKAVELEVVKAISHNEVGEILKNKLQPHLKQTCCIGRMNAAFIARIEKNSLALCFAFG